jgi:hypothetical protein
MRKRKRPICPAARRGDLGREPIEEGPVEEEPLRAKDVRGSFIS